MRGMDRNSHLSLVGYVGVWVKFEEFSVALMVANHQGAAGELRGQGTCKRSHDHLPLHGSAPNEIFSREHDWESPM